MFVLKVDNPGVGNGRGVHEDVKREAEEMSCVRHCFTSLTGGFVGDLEDQLVGAVLATPGVRYSPDLASCSSPNLGVVGVPTESVYLTCPPFSGLRDIMCKASWSRVRVRVRVRDRVPAPVDRLAVTGEPESGCELLISPVHTHAVGLRRVPVRVHALEHAPHDRARLVRLPGS